MVAVREIAEDYRKEFVRGRSSINNDELLDSVEDVLDSIADAEDGVPCYDFSEINKWHPLAYYDEIK